MRALESFIGSLGILAVGVFSIPFVAKIYGIEMSHAQGAQMSGTFFLLRWGWLYILRLYFSKKGESCNKCEEK